MVDLETELLGLVRFLTHEERTQLCELILAAPLDSRLEIPATETNTTPPHCSRPE